MVKNDDRPYFEIYDIDPMRYVDLKVDNIGFSIRLGNRLLENDLYTVDALLKENDSTLRNVKGLGKSCFGELHKYLKTISDSVSVAPQPVKERKIPRAVVPFIDQMVEGDFEFLIDNAFDDSSLSFIHYMRESFDLLGTEMVEDALNGIPEIFSLLECLKDFIKRTQEKQACDLFFATLPKGRTEISAHKLILAYSSNQDMQNYLFEKCEWKEDDSLVMFIKRNAAKFSAHNQYFSRFIKWCKFDVLDEINRFFKMSMKNDRELEVVCQRAERKTLEMIGQSFGVTRERIRQIESKVGKRFNIWQKKNRIIYKLFIELKEDTAVSTMELIDFIKDYGTAFVYLMKFSESNEVIYDKSLDMFIMENQSMSEKIQAYVEALPDMFAESKLPGYLEKAEEEYDYPVKMVAATIEENYKKTGETYHRVRLSLTAIYAEIFVRFYPNGIHVYDESEIAGFRKHVKEEFSIDIDGKSDHAIGSILSRIGILCGRGIYKLHSDKQYISKDLAKNIHDYIVTSDSPIFMTNTLFSLFEDELVSHGVDNKYFLQGILRDLYENEWIFRKDYISKDESYTSVYSSIVGFIKNSFYPVSKEDIYKAFPGVTEIVISLAVSDVNVLNLFGLYIHSSRLKLSSPDIQYLKETVERFLENKDVCHCKELYEYINSDYPVLMTNNFISFPFGLHSLLEFLFSDHYNFSRPFVARENAKIERVGDILRDMIRASDIIAIQEVMSFVREQHFTLYSILDFVDSCNETHLLINDQLIGSIEYIGVTEEIAKNIEAKIFSEIVETIPIHQLQCIHSLPTINVPWNAWLIYSVLKKWSEQLDVATSASQFKQSYPLIAPKGMLSITTVDTSVSHHGNIAMADDLSKIDDLISDFLEEDLDINGL